MPTPEARDARRRRAMKRARVWGWVAPVLALVIILGAVWSSSYAGRQALIKSQRAACERGKLDRAANAEGWRTAERARRATGTHADLIVAELYDRIATGLEARARIDCKEVFPDARLLDFGRGNDA